MKFRFSIIVPAYNEEKLLPRLLESIKVAAKNFDQGDIELIVADNASTDRTVSIAHSFGFRTAKTEKVCIAAVRNAGAKIARGEVLCFIDADSALHPDTFKKIHASMSNPRFIVGATGIYLERKSAGLLLTYFLMVPMLWLLKMDTGVVFCRRDDFEAVGGYNEDLLLGEDIAFLMSLKQKGRENGQSFSRLRAVKALGSTRKFDDHGEWHYWLMGLRFVKRFYRQGFGLFAKQDDMSELAGYWYDPRR